MPAYKDERYNTWYTAFYYTDWQGKRVKKMKRGFATKKEAQEWEPVFLQQQTQDLDMPFASFCELYENDMKARIKLNTWLTKEQIQEWLGHGGHENTQLTKLLDLRRLNKFSRGAICRVYWSDYLTGIFTPASRLR